MLLSMSKSKTPTTCQISRAAHAKAKRLADARGMKLTTVVNVAVETFDRLPDSEKAAAFFSNPNGNGTASSAESIPSAPNTPARGNAPIDADPGD